MLVPRAVCGAEFPSRQQQWETTLEAAKKEKKVYVYMYRYGKVLDVFKKDHPEIEPFLLSGTGAQIVTRIMAERRSGKYLADVVGLGSSNYRILHQRGKSLEPIQPALMLPESSIPLCGTAADTATSIPRASTCLLTLPTRATHSFTTIRDS